MFRFKPATPATAAFPSGTKNISNKPSDDDGSDTGSSVPTKEEKTLSVRSHPLGTIDQWKLRLRSMQILNLELNDFKRRRISPLTVKQMHKELSAVSRDFLKFVAKEDGPLAVAAGLEEQGLDLLKYGMLPENFTVHLRIPYEFGGTNEFDNLVLIQRDPYHSTIHRFIDLQLSRYKDDIPSLLYLPVFPMRVYVPDEEAETTDGKGMSDHSAFAGYDENLIKEIWQKNNRGRSVDV